MTHAAPNQGLALVVHSSLERATTLHNACVQAGLRTVVARDLPTALLMISQHVFDAAIISATIFEHGDGWSLAAVFRMIFPGAFVALMAPEKSLEALKNTINSGADQLFECEASPDDIVRAAMTRIERGAAGTVQ
jgi:DNA-binding NtrC family response regulator